MREGSLSVQHDEIRFELRLRHGRRPGTSLRPTTRCVSLLSSLAILSAAESYVRVGRR